MQNKGKAAVVTHESVLQTETLKNIVFHVFETMKQNPHLIDSTATTFSSQEKKIQDSALKSMDYLRDNFKKMGLQSAALTSKVVAMMIGFCWRQDEQEEVRFFDSLLPFLDKIHTLCISMVHDTLSNEVINGKFSHNSVV